MRSFGKDSGFTSPSVSIELRAMAPTSKTTAHYLPIPVRALALAVLCWLAGPAAAPTLGQLPRLEPHKADLVVVYKNKRVLQLMHNGRLQVLPHRAGARARRRQAQVR